MHLSAPDESGLGMWVMSKTAVMISLISVIKPMFQAAAGSVSF